MLTYTRTSSMINYLLTTSIGSSTPISSSIAGYASTIIISHSVSCLICIVGVIIIIEVAHSIMIKPISLYSISSYPIYSEPYLNSIYGHALLDAFIQIFELEFGQILIFGPIMLLFTS